ncbi:hypothetical protein XENORESO_016787 [Xenotaenia resolanae]|uniref:Uncharacterized protein n=1 Tax=Xenotaenia resolanae TaxID=208358 RepID=A0ABV0W3D5_9TELE
MNEFCLCNATLGSCYIEIVFLSFVFVCNPADLAFVSRLRAEGLQGDGSYVLCVWLVPGSLYDECMITSAWGDPLVFVFFIFLNLSPVVRPFPLLVNLSLEHPLSLPFISLGEIPKVEL